MPDALVDVIEVKAPVFAVVAPTVPLMLIDAVPVRPVAGPVNWVVASIVVPRTVEAVVAPTVVPSMAPPVIATLLAFCAAIEPSPVMSELGIVAEAVMALVPLPLT